MGNDNDNSYYSSDEEHQNKIRAKENRQESIKQTKSNTEGLMKLFMPRSSSKNDEVSKQEPFSFNRSRNSTANKENTEKKSQLHMSKPIKNPNAGIVSFPKALTPPKIINSDSDNEKEIHKIQQRKGPMEYALANPNAIKQAQKEIPTHLIFPNINQNISKNNDDEYSDEDQPHRIVMHRARQTKHTTLIIASDAPALKPIVLKENEFPCYPNDKKTDVKYEQAIVDKSAQFDQDMTEKQQKECSYYSDEDQEQNKDCNMEQNKKIEHKESITPEPKTTENEKKEYEYSYYTDEEEVGDIKSTVPVQSSKNDVIQRQDVADIKLPLPAQTEDEEYSYSYYYSEEESTNSNKNSEKVTSVCANKEEIINLEKKQNILSLKEYSYYTDDEENSKTQKKIPTGIVIQKEKEECSYSYYSDEDTDDNQISETTQKECTKQNTEKSEKSISILEHQKAEKLATNIDNGNQTPTKEYEQKIEEYSYSYYSDDDEQNSSKPTEPNSKLKENEYSYYSDSAEQDGDEKISRPLTAPPSENNSQEKKQSPKPKPGPRPGNDRRPLRIAERRKNQDRLIQTRGYQMRQTKHRLKSGDYKNLISKSYVGSQKL